MSRIAFLITNRYQIFHYLPLLRALGEECTFVIETRDQDFGVDEEFLDAHAPGTPVDGITKDRLHDLDGRYELLICQTPPLLHSLLDKSLVVAQQYSLGKERYQYGSWRTLADLNLMYGSYSLSRVQGFSNAVATGHSMFDAYFADGARTPGTPLTGGLYLPTYGSLSSLPTLAPLLGELDCEITVKLHHMDGIDVTDRLPANCKVVGAEHSPIHLLQAAEFVISDYSGAAYDALYARRPVVLAGPDAPDDRDLARLSAADVDRRELRPLAEVWSPGRPLPAAVEAARDRVADDHAHRAFVERFFVNHGSAANAAADAIRELLEFGRPGHFGPDQVRETYREHLTKVRRLRATNTQLRSDVANLKVENRELIRPSRVVERWYRAAKRRIHRALAPRRP